MLANQLFKARLVVARSSLAARNFSTFKEKQRGDEKQFFNKEEQEQLKKLLKKMEAQQEDAETQVKKCEDDLRALMKKHNIEQDTTLVHDLMDWKYQ